MTVENIPLRMVRDRLDDIPRYELPAPYAIRSYRPGDELAWRQIHNQADRYNAITPELFEEQFGNDPKLLAARQFYLCEGAGQPIGTATAWLGLYRRQNYGRVHWVAIVPEFQGLGLAKPLMTVVCERLRQLGHWQVYLTTATARIPAIALYLKFGFKPDIQSEQDRQAWRSIAAEIGRWFDDNKITLAGTTPPH